MQKIIKNKRFIDIMAYYTALSMQKYEFDSRMNRWRHKDYTAHIKYNFPVA